MLDSSRILAGKDYTRWDWKMIERIILGPCQNRDLCLEAMKTKFFKRVAGFFRCTPMGEFANLSWSPDRGAYTVVCVRMVETLLNQPEGVAFMKTDRRGNWLLKLPKALNRNLLRRDFLLSTEERFSVEANAKHRDSDRSVRHSSSFWLEDCNADDAYR